MKETKPSEFAESDRPTKLPFRFHESKKCISISKNGGTRSEAIFISVWMTGWTGGCIFLSLQSYVEPHPGTMLLAGVFWIFWLIVGYCLLWILFGTESMELTGGKLMYERRTIIPTVRRTLPQADLVCFRPVQSLDVDDEPYFSIELVTTDKPIRFLGGIESNHREWLVRRLNAFYGLSDASSDA